MHGLEFFGVALVILFYIVRAIYRGIRWLFLGVRRAFGLTPNRPVEPAQPQPLPRPATAPPQARPLPPPAQSRIAAEPQIAQRESGLDQNARRPDENTPRSAAPDKITLRPDGKDLVRALIWQEILSPPRSQKNPRPPQ